MTIDNFSILNNLAKEIDSAWEERESVDWAEAEQLVGELKKLPLITLSVLHTIPAIIQYADDVEDWDSGVVALWPEQIQAELSILEKRFALVSDSEIYVTWSEQEVRQLRPDLSLNQAMEVLQAIRTQHNPEIGITCEVIEAKANKLYPLEQ